MVASYRFLGPDNGVPLPALSSIRASELPGPAVAFDVGGRTVRGVCATYSACGRGEFLALVGSSARVEISIRDGDAASRIGASVGDPVVARIERGKDLP